LRETLTSALNQTYPNIEIIVSDNCSTDSTEAYVESIDDPRIRYFRHAKNIGAPNNFNYCLDQARGDYFLLLHDDDLIDKDFVETCIREASYDTDFGIIRTGTRVVDSKGDILHESENMAAGLPTEDFFRAWFLGKTSFYLCNTLFNTKKLRAIGGRHTGH
jgi:glycosyltransferase involved in cell wall biosynthesis